MKLLTDEFLAPYVKVRPPWGPVGLVTYKRTYSRSLDTCPIWEQLLAERFGVEDAEEWWLTVARVVEGTYAAQEQHCYHEGREWNLAKAARSARRMYDLIWRMKFLPPGRGLWMMGTSYVDRKGAAALNNCAFVTTTDVAEDFADPFCFLMDMSMLGVGVGWDTNGAGDVFIRSPQAGPPHVVEDTREGWVALVRRILNSYVGHDTMPLRIDYSRIRPAGTPIHSFGGVASGSAPLEQLVLDIKGILGPLMTSRLTSTAIADIMNAIGRCVVSGNVRRSAEIGLGDPHDETFLRLKSDTERLSKWGWASNNSVVVERGQDYSGPVQHTQVNGEPGYFWLGNARRYGRMSDPPNLLDWRAVGTNPCSEQTLENKELCCLVETFPSRHESLREYMETLKYAYLYAKTVTLLPTHNSRTNAVIRRNRRIGCSMTGVTESMKKHGTAEHFRWCDVGYRKVRELDDVYSEWLGVPRSIKVTSVKPSGTVSKLPGVSSGVHFETAEFYYQVIRFASDSPMLPVLAKAGYMMFELAPQEPNTTAVYFPVKVENFDRSEWDVSIWEKAEIAAKMQAYWADNQVSVTVSFKPEEKEEIPRLLEYYEDRLKSISFLPLVDHGYAHAPKQPIGPDEYLDYVNQLGPVEFGGPAEVIDDFCDSSVCTV